MIQKDGSNEILFAKYQERGAYHWSQYFGSTFKTDTFLRGRYDLVVNQLSKLQISNSTKILEIGCGDGALCGLLYKKFGCLITGLDPSPDGIKFSQEKFSQQNYKGSFIVAEGYEFPFDTGVFDVILCCDVIEHLQKPDAMVKEINRLLRPGGTAIITTPIRTNEIPDDKFHVMEFFPGELNKLCLDNFNGSSQITLTHPVVWFELSTHTGKRVRSLVKAYCRILDKWFGKNVFLGSDTNSQWKNFKMQCVVLLRS